MTEAPWIAAIGFKRFLLDLAARAGARVLLIDTVDGLDMDARGTVDALIGIDVKSEFDSICAIVSAWNRKYPLAGVISMSDPTLMLAARLNERLDLAGISTEVTQTLLEKPRMRQRMVERGIPTPAWRSVSSKEDLLAFAVETGGPMIVKPINGQASRNIHLLDGAAQARKLWPTLQKANESGWIAESFMQGSEFSVETISCGGQHQVLAITEKYKGENFVEIGHRIPAELPERDAASLKSAVEAFLDAMDFTFGTAHTEVILSPIGPRIVESHSRIGGDRIGRLCEIVHGVHPVQWMIEHLIGRGKPLPIELTHSKGAAIRFLTAPPGLVTSVSGVDEAKRVPGVREVELSCEPGSTVRALGSSDDRLGHVLAEGASSRIAQEACLAAAACIKISVERSSAGEPS